MADNSRPRRSALLMPGSNPRAMAKARSLPADVLIFDLEDAVAPAAKPEARALIAAALAEGGYGRRELVVRVNALATPWARDDLAANFRDALRAGLRKLDLVTREEFDVQRSVLLRTREKVEALEARVDELEGKSS